jgi:hypothetical protein
MLCLKTPPLFFATRLLSSLQSTLATRRRLCCSFGRFWRVWWRLTEARWLNSSSGGSWWAKRESWRRTPLRVLFGLRYFFAEAMFLRRLLRRGMLFILNCQRVSRLRVGCRNFQSVLAGERCLLWSEPRTALTILAIQACFQYNHPLPKLRASLSTTQSNEQKRFLNLMVVWQLKIFPIPLIRTNGQK